MQALLHSTLCWAVRLLVKPLLGPPVPIAVQRAGLKAIGLIMLSAKGVRRTARRIAGVAVDWVEPEAGAAKRVLLYLHGGAYVIGSPDSHRAITTHLAREARAVVVAVDYRLAPEHPYPAALDDVLSVYAELQKEFGAGRIAFVGDSAGGNLALISALALRDRTIDLPAAIALISPWVDMTGSGESIRSRAHRDPMLRASWIGQAARLFGGDLAPDDPRLSPLFAELRGLPPLLIQVGSEEILYDDAIRLSARADAAGVEATLKVWETQWHVFQLHAGLLDASNRALAEIAGFVNGHWAEPQR
ncbi:MAG: alpha/beta hydrolase [Panacagrimonas sp.]